MKRLRSDQGSVTLWLLGLCVTVLFLGGLSLDLWRVFTERRALAGLVDAAAAAGAQALDEGAFRSTGAILLDPVEARRAALAAAAAYPDLGPLSSGPVVHVDGRAITVEAAGLVELSLLRVLVPQVDAVPVHIRSTAALRAPPDG